MYTPEITDTQIESIDLLVDMQERRFRSLVSQFEEALVTADPDSLAGSLPIESDATPVEINRTYELIFLLINLHVYSYKQGLDIEASINAIVETYEALTEELGDKFQTVENRLNTLIATYPLWFCAHAQLSLEKRDRVLTGADFSTGLVAIDIEADTEESEDSESVAGIINNVLSISFTEDGEERMLHLHVDQRQLLNLASNLAALKEESDTLKEILENKDIEAVVV